MDLFPGSIRSLPWTTPTVASVEVIVRVDPDDTVDEVQENNNDLVTQVNVSAPGVKVSAVDPELRLASSTQTTSSWNIAITNTALLGTNASSRPACLFGQRTASRQAVRRSDACEFHP